MDQQFKVNDWVFCEFTLQQIREVKDGRVTEVTNGYSNLMSYSLNDRCFPLTIKNRVISGEVNHQRRRLSAANAMNPDIYRELVKWWLHLISVQNQPDELNAGYRSLSHFCSQQIAKKKSK